MNIDKSNGMYANAKTWNPMKGCLFDCTYCEPTFKRQAKRQKHICQLCYDYVPHTHEDRLDKIPSANIIFVAGNGDLAFCSKDFIGKIIDKVHEHNKRCPNKTYYFQSKRPEIFQDFIKELPSNAILLTTLETNRDDGYEKVSKAPKPSIRYRQFLDLDYSRKVVTIEPLMACDPELFARQVIDIQPEYIWLGLNSKPKSVILPEPSDDEVKRLVSYLQNANLEIRFKDMRHLSEYLISIKKK